MLCKSTITLNEIDSQSLIVCKGLPFPRKQVADPKSLPSLVALECMIRGCLRFSMLFSGDREERAFKRLETLNYYRVGHF